MMGIHNTKKIAKNYYRDELLLLFQNDNSPKVFTGKYKHTEDPNWVTITTIRVYSGIGIRNQTVCNHVNLNRSAVKNWLELDPSRHNHKVYFYASHCFYTYQNHQRSGLKLIELTDTPTIWYRFMYPEANMSKISELMAYSLNNE